MFDIFYYISDNKIESIGLLRVVEIVIFIFIISNYKIVNLIVGHNEEAQIGDNIFNFKGLTFCITFFKIEPNQIEPLNDGCGKC